MKEQTKTTRVKVLRPFYLSRDVIAKPGEERTLGTDIAGAAIASGKALPLTESHVPVVVPPPDKTAFRKPDAVLRATTRKGKKHD